MKRTLATIAIAVISNSTFAFDNIYVNLGGGYVVTSHGSSTTTNSNTVLGEVTVPIPSLFNLQNVNWQNTYNNGFDINVALGGNICPKWREWRVEGEFLYQNIRRRIRGTYDWQEVDPLEGNIFISPPGSPINATEKTLNVYALMANLYYDFKSWCKWTPSLGAGIGVARVKSTENTVNDFLFVVDETDPIAGFVPISANTPTFASTVFAWQIKAGLAYQFDEHFSIVGQYRLFGTSGFRTSGSNLTMNPITPIATTFQIPGNSVRGLLNNSIELNFRYTF